MKIVLDTNVILSGIFWSGASLEVIRQAIDRNIDILTSQSILNEVRNVLQDPKEKFQLSEQETDDIIAGVLVFMKMIQLKTDINIVRDPKDNHIISCAVDGDAEYIITNDKDLLILKLYRNIMIVTPKEFLEMLNV